MRALAGFATIALTLLVAAGNASAETERWAPWIGCWERFGQELLNASLKGPSTSLPIDEDEATRPRVCVALSAPNQVTLTTSIPEEPETTLTVVADGATHPVDDADCHGQQRTEWSNNGRRLFTNGELTCRDGNPRYVSGLGLITDDGVWIDVRSFRIAGRVTTRVSRYRRTDDSIVESPPTGRATLSLAEIKEASKKVSEAVLEATIAESGASVIVNKSSLVELSDAGVPPKVIDVLVALAYPERFRVERANNSDNMFRSTRSIDFGGSTYFPPVPTNYYVPFYVPTAAIGPSRGDGGSLGGGGPMIIVPPNPPGAANAINGQGYTRITPADSGGSLGTRPAIDRSASGSSGAVMSSGGSVSSSSSGSSSSSSSSSSSGGDGGGGGGGGGGDAGGGRTAQPR